MHGASGGLGVARACLGVGLVFLGRGTCLCPFWVKNFGCSKLELVELIELLIGELRQCLARTLSISLGSKGWPREPSGLNWSIRSESKYIFHWLQNPTICSGLSIFWCRRNSDLT